MEAEPITADAMLDVAGRPKTEVPAIADERTIRPPSAHPERG